MGSLERRLEALEESATTRAQPPGRSESFRKLRAVLDELASLRASGATHHRGDQRIEGEDVPRRVLGDDYSRGQLIELAAQRAADAGVFEHSEVPAIVAAMKSFADRGGGR